MISAYLENIMKGIYGKDVRQSIHDAIQQCYKDATGSPASVASIVQALEILEKRISTIVANATTTEGNAELIDIRSGADGTVYECAGDALRQQYTRLADAIDDSNQGIRLLDTLVTGNLGVDGTLDTSWLSRISTQSFLVYSKDVCLQIASGYGCIVCTYDANDELVTRNIYFDVTEAVVPANTRFRITIYKPGYSGDTEINKDEFAYGVVIKTELEKRKIDKGVLNPQIGFLKVPEKLNIAYDGTNVSLSGNAWVVYPNGNTSEFLSIDASIDASNLIIITVYFDLTERRVVLREAISSTDFDYDNLLFLFNFSINKIENKFIYRSKPVDNLFFNDARILSAAENAIANDFAANLMQIFTKYTVIGDSLACGYTKVGNVSVGSADARPTGNNWPGYLQLRTGRTFTNVAVGGTTAKDWRQTYISTADIETDCYLIGIGVNDLRQGLSIGSSEDIAEDFEDNADSYYGNFDFLIRQIKEYNPNAHIFVFTIPRSEGSTVENYNTAIRYVASLYENVHCIDLYNLYPTEYTEGFIANSFINGHYYPMVYNYMSKMIEKAICDYMLENYELFQGVPYA